MLFGTHRDQYLIMKRIIKLAGNVVVIISFLFIFRRLYQYKEEIAAVWSPNVLFVMLCYSVVFGLFVFANAFVYHYMLLFVSGNEIPLKTVIPIYCKTNLYKYLPGNVIHLVGKNQIAVESEATHPQVAFCTLMELGLAAGGALLAGLILSWDYVTDWLMKRKLGLAAVWIVLGATVAICLVIWGLWKKNQGIQNKLIGFLNIKTIRVFFLVLLYNVICQMIIGFLFLWLFAALSPLSSNINPLNVAGVYAFAWLVGFVTPGAPGGLGVREAMLTLFLKGAGGPEIIVLATILNRAVTVIGDVIAFGMGILFGSIEKRKHLR